MKRNLIGLILALCVVALPLGAIAAEQGSMQGMKDMKGMAGMSGMSTPGQMIMIGSQTVDGVTAMAHIKDIRAAMAKYGSDMTNHLMIYFNNAKTGEPMTGVAAVKVTSPDGVTGAPIKFMAMGDGFGHDIALKEKGEYTFEIGSKLSDGHKRQFNFKYAVK